MKIIAALRELRLNPSIAAGSAAPAQETRDLTPLVSDIWTMAGATAGTPAQLYLDRRGIGHSTVGRYTPAALTYEAGVKLRLPALLLPMTEGRHLRALLRIFVDRDGQKARKLEDAKRTLGDTRGSVVQLGAPPEALMNLAEGFEDAESAIILRNLTGCSAVCGVERYREIAIPDHVQRIVIYSQHGKAAIDGIERGRDNLTANGRTLEIVAPPPRCDWNDALMAKLASRA